MNIVIFIKAKYFGPKEFDKKNEGELWFAEKMICEDLSELVDDANPRVSFAQAVASYLSKWDPYSLYEVMETYFEKCPEQRFKFI
ncbi:hypothetical protein [Hoylesella nanceiensis]|uniref:Uncharacterized protein n=1 Tax=Hoylesella nanceiensis TaxID=425941 RepID=A0ABS6YF76_9BACT|nr:hypothetical protein [Hoylesella nanceiensis]MBW4769912.1 hypothetical protein [Hoylesella nanceiensis]